ncbi:MAG TPA: PGPGW domain-containing protein [Treponemataceae bacterium]|nr:PGPGW domain-containing protein [Treponemataceae bacterium]
MDFFAQVRAIIESLIHHPLWVWLGIILSLALFLASLALLPFLASWIPEDYFMPLKSRKKTEYKRGLWLARKILFLLKNLLGLILFLAGLLMLVTPGQGILTMFLGLIFLNFPGKRRLEFALIRRPAIYKGINILRRMRKKEPLQLPE